MAYAEDDQDGTEKAPPRPRSHAGPMDDEEFQYHIKALLTDAELYVDSELSPYRAEATDYYNGEPLGNEEDGRSQVVVTEVADAISGAMPSLMRMFFGPGRVVEYVPRKPQDVEAAKQATDYAGYVINEENHGFLATHSVFKDGLLKKLGVFCWYWDDTSKTTPYSLTAVSQEQLELLAADDDIKITRQTPSEYQAPAQPAAPGQPAPQPEQYWDVELTRTERDGCVVIDAVPPEEFLMSRGAKSIEKATLIGRRFVKTRSELIAMGVPEAVIDEFGGQDNDLKYNAEVISRNDTPGVRGGVVDQPESGEANDEIDYFETYPLIDFDGDGVAELRKVCALGPGYHVVSNKACDMRPFSAFCPDPEAHVLLGRSWFDALRDLQRISSMLLRTTFDSFALSVFPRIGYVEGQANYNDIVNNEIGAPIRMTTQGAVQAITHPFTGQNALPLMEKVDDLVERRTGQAKGAAGLDADALQSTEKDAAAVAVQSAQDRLELMARIFAEEALKPLFRGILQLLTKYQPRKKLVKLRGKFVEVDPAAWDSDMTASVTVALGMGRVERQTAALAGILAKQEQYYQQLGPSNPLVSLGQISGTLQRLVELAGYPDTESFFKPLPPDFDMPAPQPQASPEQMLAQGQLQIAMLKTQRELAIKESELQLKREESAIKTDLENKKLADDFTLRRYQIDAQFKANYTEQQLEADAGQQERWLAAQNQAHDQALAQEQQAHDQQLAQQQQAQEQQLAQQQAAAAQQAPSGGAE